MALTAAQRNAIFTYLGYEAEPAASYTASANLSARVDLISADPVLQAPVDALLLEIAAVDLVVATGGTQLSSSGPLKAVDEVQFYQVEQTNVFADTSVDAIKRGRMLIKRLAQRLGGQYLIIADYFSLFERPSPSLVSRPLRGW